MRLKITFICLALAAVIAIGCGSSGSSGSSSGAGGASATESTTGTTGGETSTSGDSSTGGSEESGADGGTLNKIEYIKKGDEICAKVPQEYTGKLKSMEEEAKKKNQPKPAKAETNTKAAVPPLYVAVDSFEQLTPPKGEEKQVEAIIAALESAAKGLEQKPESELSGPKSPFAEFQKLTEAYGFKGCSQL